MTPLSKLRPALAVFVLAGSGLFAPGCAQNAALEVRIMLPPAPTDGSSVFVLIQPRSAADNPFEDEWRGDDLDAIELQPSEDIPDHISVLSTDASTDLNLKVRFCASPNCTAIEDDTAPELWYALGHPFYIGERTSWSTVISAIPTERDTAPEEIDRCQIVGCVDGPLSSYCRGDGRHLCE